MRLATPRGGGNVAKCQKSRRAGARGRRKLALVLLLVGCGGAERRWRRPSRSAAPGPDGNSQGSLQRLLLLCFAGAVGGGLDIDADLTVGIAEGLDLVPFDDNEVLIQFGSRSFPSELLRDPDLTGLMRKVVTHLGNGPLKVGDLLARLPEVQVNGAREMIIGLLDRGILTDIRRSPVEQYLRYAFTGEPSVSDRRVTIVGAGPLGARVSHSLALHGVGRLTLVDDRQVDDVWKAFAPPAMSGVGSEGLAHVVVAECLASCGYRFVEALDAGLDVDGLEFAVAQADLVVVALERADVRLGHLLNRICLRARTPWLVTTVDGNLGLVGPLFSPPDSACYNCYRALADAASPQSEMAARYRRHALRRGAAGFAPGLPAYVEILSGYTSMAAVRFLVEGSSFALARVLVFNFEQMVLETEDVLKLPRCPVCGMGKASYRSPFAPEVVADGRGM